MRILPACFASYPITRSTFESPSISASFPFDWEVAHGILSPLYSPPGPKRRGVWKSDIKSLNGKGTSAS
ncbi:hypothetical protein BJV74DRAFT_868904 [Russula compacta]|nr:hypothetical protein BJV74DRAFT_868904 [Russula compacta]